MPNSVNNSSSSSHGAHPTSLFLGNLPIFGRRRGSSGSNHVDTPLENDSDSQRSLRFGQVVTSSPGLVAGGQMVYGNGFVSAGNTPKVNWANIFP